MSADTTLIHLTDYADDNSNDEVTKEILCLLALLPDDIMTNTQKRTMIMTKIKELKKYLTELNQLDMDLVSCLKNDLSTSVDDTISSKDFPTKMNEIDNDALIIFLERADLYKIYQPDKLESDLVDHLNTYFKNKGKIYEAVRDCNPQKVMIVISDDVQDRLQLMKSYIIEFVSNYKNLTTLKNEDIIVYKNTTNTEFIAINLIVENMREKDEFMEDFQRFLRNKGEIDIANKIQIRQPASNIKGVRYYDLPRDKIPISTDNNIIDHYISKTTVSKPGAHVIMNVTNLTVNNIVNSTISTVNNVNTVNVNSKDKKLKDFYKHIYNTKPLWYQEGKLVDIQVIETAYRDFFDDQQIRTAFISRNLKGSLFLTGSRINGVTKKKLIKYIDLKKLF